MGARRSGPLLAAGVATAGTTGHALCPCRGFDDAATVPGSDYACRHASGKLTLMQGSGRARKRAFRAVLNVCTVRRPRRARRRGR